MNKISQNPKIHIKKENNKKQIKLSFYKKTIYFTLKEEYLLPFYIVISSKIPVFWSKLKYFIFRLSSFFNINKNEKKIRWEKHLKGHSVIGFKISKCRRIKVNGSIILKNKASFLERMKSYLTFIMGISSCATVIFSTYILNDLFNLPIAFITFFHLITIGAMVYIIWNSIEKLYNSSTPLHEKRIFQLLMVISTILFVYNFLKLMKYGDNSKFLKKGVSCNITHEQINEMIKMPSHKNIEIKMTISNANNIFGKTTLSSCEGIIK